MTSYIDFSQEHYHILIMWVKVKQISLWEGSETKWQLRKNKDNYIIIISTQNRERTIIYY